MSLDQAAHITYHPELVQGSDEWLAARCGLLTASEMRKIITPSLKPASNEKARAHVWELLAQRITRHVEPSYIGDDMLRGQEDEIYARAAYAEHYAPVTECGFVTNNRWGFTLGCSPDGLVGDDGGIECKSRKQRLQVQTIVECLGWAGGDEIPDEFILQVQTCLLVTERKWWDFISYSGGLPMAVVRVEPDAEVQSAILDAAAVFEEQVAQLHEDYAAAVAKFRMIPTERVIHEHMFV